MHCTSARRGHTQACHPATRWHMQAQPHNGGGYRVRLDEEEGRVLRRRDRPRGARDRPRLLQAGRGIEAFQQVEQGPPVALELHLGVPEPVQDRRLGHPGLPPHTNTWSGLKPLLVSSSAMDTSVLDSWCSERLLLPPALEMLSNRSCTAAEYIPRLLRHVARSWYSSASSTSASTRSSRMRPASSNCFSLIRSAAFVRRFSNSTRNTWRHDTAHTD